MEPDKVPLCAAFLNWEKNNRLFSAAGRGFFPEDSAPDPIIPSFIFEKNLAFSVDRWYTHFNNLHMEAHSMVTVSTCAQFYFSYYYFFPGKR